MDFITRKYEVIFQYDNIAGIIHPLTFTERK